MREVRYSAFIHQLNKLLAQGEAKFGAPVADQKGELVYDTIDHYLAQFPVKPRDPSLCTVTPTARASIQLALSGRMRAGRTAAKVLPTDCPLSDPKSNFIACGKSWKRLPHVGQDFPRGVLVQPAGSSHSHCRKRSKRTSGRKLY